jgi:hypothetical protein
MDEHRDTPPSPDYQGGAIQPIRKRRAWVTLAFADRLERIATERGSRSPELQGIAARLRRCGSNQSGWKCELLACPRCQARASKRLRARLEMELARTRRLSVSMVTLTLGADDVGEGRKTLVSLFARLRGRTWWGRNVIAGHVQVEIEPARGPFRKWNVHLHALVWAVKRIDPDELREHWKTLVARRELAGSAHVTPIHERFVPFRGHERA